MFCCYCNKEFIQSDWRQKYCSIKCRQTTANRKNYKKNHKDLISRMQKWRLDNPSKARKLEKRWKEIRPDYNRKYLFKSRIEALKHYGKGKVECACCKERIMEMLSIDHINDGGRIHRKLNKNSRNLTIWVTKNNYPEGFQILCVNCNWAKSKYGECPHKNPKAGIYPETRA